MLKSYKWWMGWMDGMEISVRGDSTRLNHSKVISLSFQTHLRWKCQLLLEWYWTDSGMTSEWFNQSGAVSNITYIVSTWKMNNTIVWESEMVTNKPTNLLPRVGASASVRDVSVLWHVLLHQYNQNQFLYIFNFSNICLLVCCNVVKQQNVSFL